ncbi:hypothetical protein KIN20_000579 [Parelaphostrongylus tenuis]|uniref:Uncharacterized protein n=1 Tax=Parelaphostrongylus tenuis TaxID=148309 RepID=A0AAD5MBG8_PARTN|nr:hypothetical protein KIN20_000579 [Parelaphostrongylus tenuis]
MSVAEWQRGGGGAAPMVVVVESCQTSLSKAVRNLMQLRNEIQLDFLEQCMIGDEFKVLNMLNAKIVDNTYHHPINGWTALHWAARRGHENICVLLLKSGFSKELEDINGRTPWEVCSEENLTLKDILRPPDRLMCENQTTMTENGTSVKPAENGVGNRRFSSAAAIGNDRFVPNYIRHPPFPYGKSSSLDYGTNGVTVSRSENGYYSYGRRDSLKKTRFLLVRTSFSDGKEAFKRVTLPGGASLTQLKRVVEKSVRKGEVEAIMTLPDKVLVEDDAQVAEFSDCQKIDVIYKSTTRSIEKPIDERGADFIAAAVKNDMESESEGNNADTMNSNGDGFSISMIEQPGEHEQTDSIGVVPENNWSHEDTIATTTVPDVNVSVAMSENNESHSEMEYLPNVSLRKSDDSDPGDFVKIDGADNGNSNGQSLSSSQIMTSNTLEISSPSNLEDKGKGDVRSPGIEHSDEALKESPATSADVVCWYGWMSILTWFVMPLQQQPSWAWRALVVSFTQEKSAVVEFDLIVDMVRL